MTRRVLLWCAWLVVVVATSSALAWSLRDGRRALFVPGRASDGHYQIIERCELCHSPLAGVRQEACLACHGEELDRADDSHPPAKFADPRNADRVAALDARRCVTCHAEHRPERTDRHGVTLPAGLCRACHAEIAVERTSHVGMDFDGCRTTGCHNFHDNRALTQEHVALHLDEPALLPSPQRPRARAEPGPPWRALTAAEVVAPEAARDPVVIAAWAASAHAAAGVGCDACHGGSRAWGARGDDARCEGCHPAQATRFSQGRHGMRRAVGLAPLAITRARLAMAADAPERAPGCASCHDPHGLDRERAAAAACLGCHADGHSRAWVGSAHAQAFWREARGPAPLGEGASCATCHMPALDGVTEHNQSATLRPAENMLRPVCQHCHGLSFALDALADPNLAASCYTGAPALFVATPAMVAAHQRRNP